MVLLLLVVFLTVNLAALVLRREQVDHRRYRAPVVLPVLGLASCLLLATREGGFLIMWCGRVRGGAGPARRR